MGISFSKVEAILGRARLWFWVAGIILAASGPFSWLAHQVGTIAAYGYAAAILTGVAFACLIVLAISIGAIAWSRIFASPLDARKSDSAKIEETKPYLSDAIVVSGKDGTVPSFRARFARNGRDAAFYIEYSVFFGGVGGGWTVPITVPIQTVGRFTRGETIPIPLMRVVETREGPRWQFGEEMKNGFPVHMIGGGHIYRGRVQIPVSGRRCSILLFCRSVP